MRYTHENRNEWLEWFMAPTAIDREEIKHALRSIPGDAWSFVETRLFVALDDERARLEGEAQSAQEGQPVTAIVPRNLDPDRKFWQLVKDKEKLYHDERSNRRPGGPRAGS